MDNPDGEAAILTPFRVEKADLNIQFNFVEPFLPLATNMALLYVPLLDHMRQFGIGAQAIRTDAGDGSLGGFNVNFWVLQFGALVRIRLESAELHCSSLAAVNVDDVERVLLTLDEVLRAAHNELRYAGYNVTVSFHGQPVGIESREYLSRFVNNVPRDMGASIGSGVVFYFGEQPPRVIASVTLDLSAAMPDRVFVKLNSIFGSELPLRNLRQAVEQQLRLGLHGIGLEIEQQ